MGTKAGWTFYYYYYFFLYLGRTNTERRGVGEILGEKEDGPDGGRRRQETNHQLWIFRFCGPEKKKSFLLFFFIGFFYYLILLFCCYRFITVLFTV